MKSVEAEVLILRSSTIDKSQFVERVRSIRGPRRRTFFVVLPTETYNLVGLRQEANIIRMAFLEGAGYSID